MPTIADTDRKGLSKLWRWQIAGVGILGWLIILLSTVGVTGGVAYKLGAFSSPPASSPEPAVGLYWQSNADPTIAPGVSAPMWQLLWRTDAPSVYYKSGTANTAWTLVGTGTSSGGTVTSIACGAGLSCAPGSPITTTGTISFGSTGTTGDLSAWTGANTLGNFAGAAGTGCTAGNVTTNVSISAAGAITNTCTAIGTAGGITGSGTSGTSVRFTGTTSVGNGSWSDTGSALSTSVAVTLGSQVTPSGKITPPSLSTTQNDYNPTGLATAFEIDQAATANVVISGLVAQPSGTLILLRNISAANTISLSNLSVNSATANQFSVGATVVLQAGASILLYYGGSNWLMVALGSGGGQFEVSNLIVDTLATVGQLRYGVQSSTLTGTNNDIALNSTASVLYWTGASSATFTGFQSGGAGRILFIQNASTNDLTLADETGSSANRQLKNPGAANIVLKGSTTAGAIYVYDATGGFWRLMAYTSTQLSQPLQLASSTNRGTITLSGGTGTATVQSGAICTCTDTTANASVKCAVSTTTLTATGTGTDVIAYLCL